MSEGKELESTKMLHVRELCPPGLPEREGVSHIFICGVWNGMMLQLPESYFPRGHMHICGTVCLWRAWIAYPWRNSSAGHHGVWTQPDYRLGECATVNLGDGDMLR